MSLREVTHGCIWLNMYMYIDQMSINWQMWVMIVFWSWRHIQQTNFGWMYLTLWALLLKIPLIKLNWHSLKNYHSQFGLILISKLIIIVYFSKNRTIKVWKSLMIFYENGILSMVKRKFLGKYNVYCTRFMQYNRVIIAITKFLKKHNFQGTIL